ncbi:L-ascorbate metabolism protein UlaG, beta-lactamase superfamily [Lentzea xinjiangensis]|uniref:L-ascorbate metabolism protein UlaG, beta-lactamase superfamily n=1 Tax=Lentzea xinjiangensis TaxID=402600 RepID=A0A1H9Q101_9PSEU|nr:MBL fold metallo-hydrolase [Lentzea xinjiangensis]SER54266.1 L-ascorbate metabolism protein UlaG, beta-lactamase superfamily [Lentzea xinjiangensis]
MKKALAAVLGLAGVAWALRDVPAQLGGTPDPRRMARSPRYREGVFHNDRRVRTVPDRQAFSLAEFVSGGTGRAPSAEVPLVGPAAPVSEGLHITWYGHASALVEVDGAAVLVDPVWSDRCSPSSRMGPKRLHPVPHRLADLPALSAVVISHDHYDHLDMDTVRELTRTTFAKFVVPLGIGAHLARWGVPEDRIVELDWDESFDVDGFTLTCTAAQHFSGRSVKRNVTLWASWVIARGGRKVFYSGDTGYFDGYRRIGAEHGPFDAVLMQVGAYNAAWPDIHMTPEEGVTAFEDLGGALLIPVHWATFNLALHPWGEPIDRVWREAKARGLALAVPRPGERVDVDAPGEVDGWWQALA